ncbi:VOC family protein [Chitinibacter bivalviorum]|uniref:VOC family protein n=1 Tax=Chitinibacter bivalviorum TaxID=2739434 RepID=A0A7H9BI22_9NEIS|nr:VOC family protein [Chitinibacter bivalviorum]QLG87194.1 VOC family protein [Chitinibacter bivalviorum]
MEPRVSFITLGVADLAVSLHFYRDILGLTPRKIHDDVVFFAMGASWLALYPRHLLALDAGVAETGHGFRGVALAHNVRSQAEVDQLLHIAQEGGGKLIKPAQPTSWGGYAGYFADPDGHLWEVAWNPEFPID